MAELWKVYFDFNLKYNPASLWYSSIERRILNDEDKAIENAKWGLGIAAVLGRLSTNSTFVRYN